MDSATFNMKRTVVKIRIIVIMIQMKMADKNLIKKEIW